MGIKRLKEHDGSFLQVVRDRKPGLPTGFPTLDDMLFGINPGYYIIAARPSVGKTSLAMNLAINMAQTKSKVLFFSLEMPESYFLERIVSILSCVSPKEIREDRIPVDCQEGMGEIDINIRALDISVDYTTSRSPGSIRGQLEFLEQQEGYKPDVVFVDYIQYMRSNQNEMAQKASVLTEISRGLVECSKDLTLPIITLAQLSRGADEYSSSGDRKVWKPKRPRLSDLKGSGALEEDTDGVIFIHREDYHKEREQEEYDSSTAPVGNAEFIIAKNRHGPCGSFPVTWFPHIFKFVEGE